MKTHGDGTRDTEYNIMAYVYCTFQESKYVHCTVTPYAIAIGIFYFSLLPLLRKRAYYLLSIIYCL